jgi:stage V sporulation protein D (sporulation-specific penicillin-binding protein)
MECAVSGEIEISLRAFQNNIFRHTRSIPFVLFAAVRFVKSGKKTQKPRQLRGFSGGVVSLPRGSANGGSAVGISPSLKMKKKMTFLLIAIFAIGFSILIVRLVVLQIIDGSFFAQKALKQQLSTITIWPNRGTIYDRNMTPLAESATVWDVIAQPAYIKTDAQANSIADSLSVMLDVDRQKVYTLLRKKSSYEVIKKKIEKSTADLVNEYIKDNNISGLGLIEDSKRYYPFGNFASQLLGFTGTDNQGLGGIEGKYDSVLKGTAGRVVTAKNAAGTGMPFDYTDAYSAVDGDNVITTIDEVVQSSLENNLTKAVADDNVTNRATAIAMNVKTGEILGMATTPGYDPNDPYTITDKTVQQLLSTKSGDDLKKSTSVALQAQWRNKAITEPNEPGSVFKVITAAAGLETGAVKEDSTFFDPGSIAIGGKNFHCWKYGGHGSQTFLQGFENSCNIVFITLGQRMGPANFFKYFSNFGLTAKTGIDLPGEAASIYYKEKSLGPVQLASCSFGQSNKMTPIELITAIAASANGGKLVTPHVVKAITDQSGKVIKTFGTTVKTQAISVETSKEIDHLMQMEVIEGTGKNAYVTGYRIGGKTGTSQKLDSADKNARIASFVGVAPCDDPQIAVLVILDEPHSSNTNFGGVIAAPVAGSIFSEILPYLGVTPKYTDAELQNLEVKTPDVTGKSITEATNAIKGQNLTIKVMGTGQSVTTQVPGPQESIAKGGTVIVYTGDTRAAPTVSVPRLVGLTPEQANSALAAANLNIRFVGVAQDDTGDTAYEQDTAVGSMVEPGTAITVKFRDNSAHEDTDTG